MLDPSDDRLCSDEVSDEAVGCELSVLVDCCSCDSVELEPWLDVSRGLVGTAAAAAICCADAREDAPGWSRVGMNVGRGS